MELISSVLNNKLNEITGKCFSINRFLDRGMSLIATKWKMPNAADLLHPKLAHAYLGDSFADAIAAYQRKRGNLSEYPATPEGREDYDSPIQLINRFYRENLELQDMLYDAIDEAIEEGDGTTKKFLDSVLETLSDYTDAAQALVDAFSSYGNEPFKLQMLDVNIDKYLKL